MTSKWK